MTLPLSLLCIFRFISAMPRHYRSCILCNNTTYSNPSIVIFNTNICELHYEDACKRAHAGTLRFYYILLMYHQVYFFRLLPGSVPTINTLVQSTFSDHGYSESRDKLVCLLLFVKVKLSLLHNQCKD